MTIPKVSLEARIATADLLDKVSELLDHNGIGQVADLVRDGEYDEHEAICIVAQFEQLIRSKVIDEAAGEGWQDIATAPPSPPYITFRPGVGVGLCVQNLLPGVPQLATHWRPLPAPPRQLGERGR